MIRERAHVEDTLRLIAPNLYTLAVLPPGAVIEVTGHVPDQPSSFLGVVRSIPDAPKEYHIIVPRGAIVKIHEEE